MKNYTVTITLSITADNDDEAWKMAEKRLTQGDYDHDSIEIEEE
jgi:hypothetical protein